MIDKKYNVIFASDNGYAQHLCVAIYSCIKNFKYKEELTITVLDAGISNNNKEKILKSCDKFPSKIIFKKADCSIFTPFKTKQYNDFTYTRLLATELFPSLDKGLQPCKLGNICCSELSCSKKRFRF